MRINGKEFTNMTEMVKKSGKSPNAIKQWLFNHGIKPMSREALYEPAVLDKLLQADPPGRPKKDTSKKTK